MSKSRVPLYLRRNLTAADFAAFSKEDFLGYLNKRLLTIGAANWRRQQRFSSPSDRVAEAGTPRDGFTELSINVLSSRLRARDRSKPVEKELFLKPLSPDELDSTLGPRGWEALSLLLKIPLLSSLQLAMLSFLTDLLTEEPTDVLYDLEYDLRPEFESPEPQTRLTAFNLDFFGDFLEHHQVALAMEHRSGIRFLLCSADEFAMRDILREENSLEGFAEAFGAPLRLMKSWLAEQ